MIIDVEFVGPLKRPWPERRRSIEIGDGALLVELLRSLGFNDDEARHLACAVNGVGARPRTALQEGDRVVVSLLLGGG